VEPGGIEPPTSTLPVLSGLRTARRTTERIHQRRTELHGEEHNMVGVQPGSERPRKTPPARVKLPIRNRRAGGDLSAPPIRNGLHGAISDNRSIGALMRMQARANRLRLSPVGGKVRPWQKTRGSGMPPALRPQKTPPERGLELRACGFSASIGMPKTVSPW